MKCNKHISASTLPELLVLMILCGIVFLGVMDGMRLVDSFVRSLTERIGQNSDFYAHYDRLEGLIATADSLHSRDGLLDIYRRGSVYATLRRRDSLLIVRMDSRTDTLFTTLIRWDTLPGSDPWDVSGIDTLSIGLQTPHDSVVDLSFGRFRLADPRQQDLWQTETRYRYEP